MGRPVGCVAHQPLTFHPVMMLYPPSPRKGLCADDSFPALSWLLLWAPPPPSCPQERLGSDHLDVWALPTGQGGSAGGWLLPAPSPLPPGLPCCFCAKVSQSPLPALSLGLPPQPQRPSCPTPTQRIYASAQDVGLMCVSESSMYLCLHSIHATQAGEAHPWTWSVSNLVSCPQCPS